MALKVWLPLNGDLKNYGCSDTEITNNGVTTNANGKIGSCYSFNGSSSNIKLSNSFCSNTMEEFSYTCWVKVNATTCGCLFSARTAVNPTGVTIFINNSNNIFFDIGNERLTIAYPLATNTWYHLAFTYKKNDVKCIYANGVLIGRTSSTATTTTATNIGFIGASQNTATTINDNYLNGYLNDVRIYNHRLSIAEVKEISQGLVLHYTMNYTNPNLAIGSRSLNLTQGISNTYWGLRQAPPTIKKDGFTVATVNVAFRGVSCWANSLNLVAGNNYTISCTGYTNNATNTNVNLYFYPMMYNSSGTRDTATTIPISVMGGPFTNVNSKLISKMSVIPTRYWATFTWTTAMADLISNGGKVEISLQVSGTFNEGDLQSIYAPKLENGDVPTPWRLSLSEEGLSQDVMFDSSGYNHNGIINNFVKPSADTRRGLMALHLVNGDSMINCGRGGMVTDSITVNMWIKASSWANPVSCTESGGWNFESNSGSITFPVYITDIGYVQTKNGTNAEIVAPATVADNTWHMLTGVYDRVGQTVKLYLDGELKQQNTVSAPKLIKYHSSNSIWIGGEATASSASNGMAGLFSDFRIYCTPLLDNDIKLLYNIGMKVDNLGSLHTYELEETNVDKLLKTGVLKGQGFYENGYVEILHYDKNIYTEPDGSVWIHICHHNNPANGVFSSNGSWATGYYIDANRWYDVEQILSNLINYEFMVKQKTTSSATEVKYRWIQSINPRNATWDDVKPGTITYITTSGYTDGGLGGLYYRNDSNQRMCIANNNSGNWYGGIGVWAAYNGGIPGYPNTVVTSGYVDLYARIYMPTKLIKNIGFNSMNFIEM